MRSHPALFAALTISLAACGDPGSSAGLDQPPPTPEERMADWEAQPQGASVPVALGFGGALPDSAIAALLSRRSVRPYAVYLMAAGRASSLRRERSRASLEVLGEAREQAVAQLRTSLCAEPGRIRAELDQGDDLERARRTLVNVLALQRSVPELETGAPAVYGIEAVGSVEDVRALRDEPEVVSWEPGWRARIQGVDTVVVPRPPEWAAVDPAVDSSVLALDAAEVRARLVALTENGLGSCEGVTPSDEPR